MENRFFPRQGNSSFQGTLYMTQNSTYRATEQLARAGGWEWNAQTDDVHWTPGTYELFGHAPDTPLDYETALSYFHPDTRPALEQAIEQCLETGIPYELELRIQTRDTPTRWVQVRGEPIDDDGEQIGLRGAIVDVTKMKEREQRLQVLNRILRHNLRNDLNVIQGRAELLSEELEGLDIPPALFEMDDVGPFLEELDRLAQDAESLQEEIAIVEDGMSFLTSFSIDEAKTCADIILDKSTELDGLGEKTRGLDTIMAEMTGNLREPVGVRLLLEGVKREFASEFPEATIDIDCDEDIQVLGIEGPLERAIAELVENALHHADTPGVQVSMTATESAEGHIEICVVDDGPGIPAMERETLRRGTESPVFHGQGIGLWMVTWIVHRQNGTIEIQDREPQGSIVCLNLPQPRSDG
jgi:PAS domain S-box-containing protein